MGLITYSEFVTRVKRQVWPDSDTHLEPINAAFPHGTFIQNALIQAQTYVECLRQNNVNTYTLEDAVVNCGVAIFEAPDHIRVGAIYAYKPTKGCTRQTYFQQSVNEVMCYVDRFAACECRTESDICNAVRDGYAVCDELALCDDWTGEESDAGWLCDDKIFAVGKGSRIYVAPRIPCSYRLAVHWEGVKYRYADTDLISDDPDLLDVVATYVQAERARTFDRDLPLYKELLGNGPARRGKDGSAWHIKIAAMNHRCREERRIRVRPCLEMWDDSAVSSENIGAQLDPLPDRDQAGIAFTAVCEAQTCPDGQQLIDGVCVDCEDPIVTIDAEQTELLIGQSTTLSWSNTVPVNTVVTLEYGSTVVTLANNTSGTLVVTPTERTIYRIHAEGPCGNIIDSVLVDVEEPCLCPDGLPDCLQLTKASPSDFSACTAPTIVAGDADQWDGQFPLISPCKWGFEFAEPPYGGGKYVTFAGGEAQFKAIIELISCEPYVYEMTFYYLDTDDVERSFWKGRCENHPVGNYVSLQHNVGVSDFYCYENTNFAVSGCFDTPCTPPVIRFDPPAGARVHFPSIVFIHSTNDDDNIFYSLDGGTEYAPYTGPISLGIGQTLHAKSVTLAGCPSAVTNSNYTADGDGLDFDFLCDEVDEAGVFYAFYADGGNDYHWRINITRTLPWVFRRATIYETNSSGIWVTGQAWSTVSQIYPVEIAPAMFTVYPLVLTDGTNVINTSYAEPVDASVPAGNQVYHGYGQPFIALTGYFRLELILSEGGAPFTLYKLIPHTCFVSTCPTPAPPTATVDCEGLVVLTGVVTPGSQYRVRRAYTGVPFVDVASGISLTGTVSYTEFVILCADYSYIISEYCVETGQWVDSTATLVHAPCPEECAAECNAAELDDLYVVDGWQTMPVACVGGECSGTIWDGIMYRTNPNACSWAATGFDGTVQGSSIGCFRMYLDEDGALHSATLTIESGLWTLRLVTGTASSTLTWIGTKDGPTPSGVYNRTGGSSCPDLEVLTIL